MSLGAVKLENKLGFNQMLMCTTSYLSINLAQNQVQIQEWLKLDPIEGTCIFLPAATFGAVRSTGAKVLDVGGGGLEYSEMSRRNKSIGPSAPTFWWWRYIVSRQNITGPSAPSFFHM